MGAQAAELLINASGSQRVEKSVIFPIEFALIEFALPESTGPAPAVKRNRAAAK